jgi:WD40 repeat protein
VGSNDRFLRFWDTETGEPIGQPFGAHTAPICDVAFIPDGEKLASASEDGTVILWRAQPKSPLSQPLGELAGKLVSAIFSPDGRVFACGTETGEIVLWDFSHGLPPARRESIRTDRRPIGLAFRADSGVLESYNKDGTLQFWETRTGQPAGDPVTILGGHGLQQNSKGIAALNGFENAVFSPNGARLAACVYDETGETAPSKLLIWDTKSGRPIGVPVKGPPLAVTSLAFNNDGTKLAAGTSRVEGQEPTGTRLGVIYLWNLSVGPPVMKELSGHTEVVSDVAFRPDGSSLASCSLDETIRFWDTESGRSSGPVLELFNRVTGIAFSPDGTVLASRTRLSFSSEASVLQLWDVSTGKPIGQPRRINNYWLLPKAPFNHSGTLMVTIEERSEKTVLTLWDTDVKSWQVRACNIANRNLSRREWLNYFEGRPYHKTRLSLPEPSTIVRPEHTTDEETF